MSRDDPLEDPIDDADEAERELRPDDPAEGLAPEIPEAPDPTFDSVERASELSNADVDPELKRQFWSLVLLFNVALFATSFGLMLVGFEGRWRVGGAMFAVGAFAFARGWRGYKSVQSD